MTSQGPTLCEKVLESKAMEAGTAAGEVADWAACWEMTCVSWLCRRCRKAAAWLACKHSICRHTSLAIALWRAEAVKWADSHRQHVWVHFAQVKLAHVSFQQSSNAMPLR